jgi:hypothetical protein
MSKPIFFFKDEKNRSYQQFIERPDGSIETLGMDYSGKITKKHELGEYQIWHKTSGRTWVGIGQTCTAPAWYVLVEVGPPNPNGRGWRKATEIEGSEVDRSTSRSYQKRLYDMMVALAYDDHS